MAIDPIQARIQEFARELEELVRSAALEAVALALRGEVAPQLPSPTPRADRNTRTGASRRAPRLRVRPAGKVRLGGSADRIKAYVKANPGRRLEQIATALGVPSPSLKELAAELVAAKVLRKTGNTRGTKYFAA